jgi:hypothetical protein
MDVQAEVHQPHCRHPENEAASARARDENPLRGADGCCQGFELGSFDLPCGAGDFIGNEGQVGEDCSCVDPGWGIKCGWTQGISFALVKSSTHQLRCVP